MHVHILGICGTFMGGIAALAREAGHRVTGSDRDVYPPMSTQLDALGIELVRGFDADQLALKPDMIIVGNVMSRGMPVVEAMLDAGLAYQSGPQWLAEHVLRERWVLAVAGTHGKTTTSSMLAWLLDHAGLSPGFLIGGVPADFGLSARLGTGPFFVIEADEYDTAFFDKRAKFVHYSPRTLVLNNLEYDHADIYPDLATIERSFQHLLRTVPGRGRILSHGGDSALERVIAAGCWTPVERFAQGSAEAQWSARVEREDFSQWQVLERIGGEVHERGSVQWQQFGAHNVDNALAAIAAAQHAGVPVAHSVQALAGFHGVARRMQLRGSARGVDVYDDFAHHPTAIATTIDGLRRRLGATGRLVAVLEPRSATMRMGVHRASLAGALAGADAVWLYAPANIGWDVAGAVAPLAERARVCHELDALVEGLAGELRAGDSVLVMSNGGFGGLHDRLLAALKADAASGTVSPPSSR